MTLFPVIFRMAVRGLIRQKKRSMIIAATGAVGIIAVTVMQGFINGFTVSLVDVAINTGLGHVQIRPEGYLDGRQMDLIFPQARRLEKIIAENLPENVSYAPRMEREAILRLGSETRGVMLIGIEPLKEAKVSDITEWKIIQGKSLDNFPAADDSHGLPCLLGARMSRLLEVESGGRVILSTGSKSSGAKSFVCRVTGVYESPSGSVEEAMVIMNLADLARVRNDGPSDEVGYFVFRGENLEQSHVIAEHFRKVLINEKGIEIASFTEMEPLMADLIKLYDSVSWIFYFVILGGFGIVLFISVTMSIFERLQEIGIMHAIGARPFFLFRLVTLESALLSLLGTFFGIIPGMLIVALLNHYGFTLSADTMDIQSWGASSASVVYPFISVRNIFESIFVALTVAFLSTIYPAIRAVRISPLEAIHRK